MFVKSFASTCLAFSLAVVTIKAATAQTPSLAIGAPAAIGGAYVTKKTVGACIRHPVLCATTAAVGAGFAYKAIQNTRRLNAETPDCSNGYVSLYRAVGSIERAEIAAIQRYVIIPTGMTEKQFMLTIEDAKFIVKFNQKYETTAAKEMFIVTSKVCTTTLAMAYRFTDGGHPVASFRPDALKFVNLDASRTGGIQEAWASGGQK